MTKIQAVTCPKCGDKIFSRSRHDFHRCSCGHVAIDGGFDYIKVCYKDGEPPVAEEIEVPQTKEELYGDWNSRADKFGIIKPTIGKPFPNCVPGATN